MNPFWNLPENWSSWHFNKVSTLTGAFSDVMQRDIRRTFFFYTSAQQKGSLFLDIRGTGESIVSTFMLFWRISINGPLNEPLLYSSWLSWRIWRRGRTKVRWSAVQRTGTKRPLWRVQMHSCQIHKRRAIFRLMAIHASGKPQHSANLDFNESKASPLDLQRAAPLSYSHLAHALLGDLQYWSCMKSSVLCTKLNLMGLQLV